MDTLKNKNYANFDYISRYTNVPYYYDTLSGRNIFGIGTNIKSNSSYVTHKLRPNDTLNSLSLKYYNNPTFWWMIAYFNNIQDPFIQLSDKYKTLKIPSMTSLEFGKVNK